MLEMLSYPFVRLALLAVVLIAMGAAVIGTYIITRRMVSIAGGVTHACFGGLGLGYFLGVSPVAMAAVFAIASSVAVEWMSRRMHLREDSVIAVIWALGMAAGVLFVFLTPGYVPELNSFLFGNILSVSPADLWSFGGFTLAAGAFTAWRYRQVVAVAFDRDFARVIGLPVRFITYTMTVLVAVGIVLTIRLVGVMLLMSMLSLPVMIAEIFCRRYSTIMAAAAGVSILAGVGGLMIATVADVPCSAIIVMLLVAAFFGAKALKTFSRSRGRSVSRG